MKFLTDYELQHLEHESLRIKYRELQRMYEELIRCNCVEDIPAECERVISDEQALKDTQKRVKQSIARDTRENINGYGG